MELFEIPSNINNETAVKNFPSAKFNNKICPISRNNTIINSLITRNPGTKVGQHHQKSLGSSTKKHPTTNIEHSLDYNFRDKRLIGVKGRLDREIRIAGHAGRQNKPWQPEIG